MVDKSDPSDKPVEAAPSAEKASDNLTKAAREGIEGAAQAVADLRIQQKLGKYISGVRARFGQVELYDGKAEGKAPEGKRDIGATVGQIVDKIKHPITALKDADPSDLVMRAGPKGADKPAEAPKAGDTPVEAGAKPGTDKQPGVAATDDAGRPTEINYGKKETFKVAYDGDGNPTKVTASDNSKWEVVGGHWKQFDENGKPVAHPEFKVDVAKDGAITFTETKTGYSEKATTNGDLIKTYPDKPGYSETIREDKSEEIRYPDNSAVLKDKDGRITEVDHKDGSKTIPEYKDGKPVKFTELDPYGRKTGSSEWDEQAKRWSIKDRHDKEVDYFEGDVKLKENGDVVRKGMFSDTNELETRTYGHDGSVTRDLRDGSSIRTEPITTKERDDKIRQYQSEFAKTAPNQEEALKKALQKVDDEEVRDLTKRYEKQVREQDLAIHKEKQELERLRRETATPGSEVPQREIPSPMTDEQVTREAERRARAELENPYKAGEVTHVKYPNGKTADFQYDKDGHLSEFKDASGQVHRKEADGWHRYEVQKDGTEAARGTDSGFYKVKPNGDLELRSKDETRVETTRRNGTRDVREYAPDTADTKILQQKSWDDKGHPAAATYENSDHSKTVAVFSYDRKGHLDGISDADPYVRGQFHDHWVKARDGSWTKYDDQGHRVDEAQSIKIDNNGDIVITSKDGKETRRKASQF